jgi:hypothetical protein
MNDKDLLKIIAKLSEKKGITIININNYGDSMPEIDFGDPVLEEEYGEVESDLDEEFELAYENMWGELVDIITYGIKESEDRDFILKHIKRIEGKFLG